MCGDFFFFFLRGSGVVRARVRCNVHNGEMSAFSNGTGRCWYESGGVVGGTR